jgi:hypothetical protein
MNSDRAHSKSFTVVFYGQQIFYRKTAQFCATRCEFRMAEIPSVSNGAQADENERKDAVLNPESLVLPLHHEATRNKIKGRVAHCKSSAVASAMLDQAAIFASRGISAPS